MRIVGHKRQEVAKQRREERNKELHDLYHLPNIITVIKPKTIRRAGM
jgi:hypothetical protein